MPTNTEKIYTIATMLRSEFHTVSICSESDSEWREELLYYSDGIYKYGARSKLEEVIGARFPKEATKSFISETLNRVRIAKKIDRTDLDASIYQINVQNGILFLNKDGSVAGLVPHTPNILSTIRIPVTYDPECDCPKFSKFLSEIVDEPSAQTILEYIGYCLYRAFPLEKWMLLVGEGENGKSRLIKVIEKFLGLKNVSHSSMQSLSENRFASSNLFGKLANLVPDLPSTDLKDTGMIKTLAGMDSISGEKKGKDAFNFSSYAKLVFSANNPPRVSDKEQGRAFWRRLLYIEFNRMFPEGDPRRDPFIVDKITTDRELSGLLNLALCGLNRLLTNGRFTYSLPPEETAVKYNLASDPIKSFVDDSCGFDAEALVSVENAYENYRLDFCAEHGMQPMSIMSFSTNFKRVCGVKVVKTRSSNKIVFKGVCLVKGRFAVGSQPVGLLAGNCA